MRPYPGFRTAVWTINFFLVTGLGISAGVISASAASPMGGMAMGHAGTSRYPAGTVIRLHQRLVQVTIVNFAFQPARLVVSPGTRIIWTNKDSDPHTVDSTTTLWTSQALDTDERFARVFTKQGTFMYYCSVHPFMHGTVIVRK